VYRSQYIDSFTFDEPIDIRANGVDWFCDETIALSGDPDVRLEADQKLGGCSLAGESWDLNELYFELDSDGAGLSGEWNIDDGSYKWLADFSCW